MAVLRMGKDEIMSFPKTEEVMRTAEVAAAEGEVGWFFIKLGLSEFGKDVSCEL